MKNDAERVSTSRKNPTYAVAHLDAIAAALALHGPVVHGKHHAASLNELDDSRTRLHARALFGEHKLATGEIALRLRQQAGDLQREHMFAVEILMQAVVIALRIL